MGKARLWREEETNKADSRRLESARRLRNEVHSEKRQAVNPRQRMDDDNKRKIRKEGSAVRSERGQAKRPRALGKDSPGTREATVWFTTKGADKVGRPRCVVKKKQHIRRMRTYTHSICAKTILRTLPVHTRAATKRQKTKCSPFQKVCVERSLETSIAWQGHPCHLVTSSPFSWTARLNS